MNKIILSLCVLAIHHQGYADSIQSHQKISIADDSDCVTLEKDIKDLEKKYLLYSQLLTKRNQEIEKLPPEASSTKMKLTSVTFMIAAKTETTKNWIKVKRNIKNNKKCPSTK